MPKPKLKRKDAQLKRKLLVKKAEFEKKAAQLRDSRLRFVPMLRVSADGTVTGNYWNVIHEMPDYFHAAPDASNTVRRHYNPLQGVR